MIRALPASLALALSLGCIAGRAQADCDAEPIAGAVRSVVADRVWVDGVAMSIAEYRSLSADDARARFAEYWRRAGAEVRTKTTSGAPNAVEVASTFVKGCLYALQLPAPGVSGLAPRLVVSDLRRRVPSMPHTFDWPPAAEGQVLTDTVSQDEHRLGRVLSYRVDGSADVVSQRYLSRFLNGSWQLGTIAKIYGSNYSFNARKANTSVDVTVTRDGSGAIVTMNFTEVDG